MLRAMSVTHFEAPAALDPLADLKDSFSRFLQSAVPPEQREDQGFHAVLRHLFPAVATDTHGESSLEYVSYSLEKPPTSPEDCLGRGATWAAPLRLVVRLVVWEQLPDGSRSIRDVKEQEVFCGLLPLPTERGTFVVDGVEVVLVARRMNLWLPGDELSDGVEVPRERVMNAAEWLGVALREGFALVVAEATTRMGAGDVETLMPHDLLNTKLLQRPLEALFADPRRCQPALTHNPLALVEQVRGVGEPIALEPFKPRQRIPRPERRTATIEPSPDGVDASVLAPFVDQASRTQAREALLTARVPAVAEAPSVQTGAERTWAQAAGLVLTAGVEGEVRWAEGGAVVLPAAAELPATFVLARRHAPAARRVVDRRVEGVMHARADTVLFEADGAADGGVALGREALVSFDERATGAIVSAAFAEAFTTVETYSFTCTRNDTKLGAEFAVTGPQLDLDGLVRLGTKVRPGDVLVGLARPTGPGQPPFEVRLREARERGESGEELIASATRELLAAARARYGEQRHLEVTFNAQTDRLELFQTLRVVEHLGDDPVNCRTVAQARAQGFEVEPGDELLFQLFYRDEDAIEAHAQDAQYAELCELRTFRNSLSRALANEPTEDASLRVPPGVEGVVVAVDVWSRRGVERGERKSALEHERRQLLETLAELADGRAPYVEPARGDELGKGVIAAYRVVVERVRPLQVGDRLVDRRGFGATVTRIDPAQGTDVIFPFVAVPSGTLTELRLAAAARARGTRFVGTPGQAELERALADAGVSPTARAGALYLLQPQPQPASGF